ncbi:MAG: hypothetical protein WCV99_18460 [Sterolibacterium sp.]|jgi:hypothetical protein
MPVALSSIPSSPSLHTALINNDGGDRDGRSPETKAKSHTSTESPAVTTKTPQPDRVTLSPERVSQAVAYIPAAPYAEIWKNGRKVAEIDIRGEVSAADGIVASHPALGSGLAAAAQRAALIARSIGGEIRVGGMVTDVPTLTMKARLGDAYK